MLGLEQNTDTSLMGKRQWKLFLWSMFHDSYLSKIVSAAFLRFVLLFEKSEEVAFWVLIFVIFTAPFHSISALLQYTMYVSFGHLKDTLN